MDDDLKLIQEYENSLNLERIHKIYHKSLETKKTTYIPFLIDIHAFAREEKGKGMLLSKINKILSSMKLKPLENKKEFLNDIQNFTTKELLIFSEEALSKKITNEDVEVLKNELKKRNDLFYEFLNFIDKVNKFYSDLYYWSPDREINDIYTLVLSIITPNEYILKYKNYLSEKIVTGRNHKFNMIDLLKDRFNSHHFSQIDVMIKDNFTFPQKIFDRKQCQIISHEYWCDNLIGCDYFPGWLKDKLELKQVYYVNDLKYIFRACFTYVDIEIEGEYKLEISIPIFYLEDLMKGCKKYKNFWIHKGLIDENGKYLI